MRRTTTTANPCGNTLLYRSSFFQPSGTASHPRGNDYRGHVPCHLLRVIFSPPMSTCDEISRDTQEDHQSVGAGAILLTYVVMMQRTRRAGRLLSGEREMASIRWLFSVLSQRISSVVLHEKTCLRPGDPHDDLNRRDRWRQGARGAVGTTRNRPAGRGGGDETVTGNTGGGERGSRATRGKGERGLTAVKLWE